jgi:hypothetical protein
MDEKVALSAPIACKGKNQKKRKERRKKKGRRYLA